MEGELGASVRHRDVGAEGYSSHTSYIYCRLVHPLDSAYASDKAYTRSDIAGTVQFAMSTSKRAASPDATSSKRPRGSSPAQPPSLHSWLHPDVSPPIMTHSPPLHENTSTFLSFSISFVPPSHVTTEISLLKEVRRMVRELNVVAEVGDLVMKDNDGAFQDGEGVITNGKGKERAREPDHRMWGVRALVLKEGRDGTKGEDDYHVGHLLFGDFADDKLLESFHDDGEKFGGDRILKVLKEERGVDVLTVCCRWVG